PAEALAEALARRGIAVELATDARGGRYGGRFPARQVHVIPSATVRAKNPLSLARTAAMLGLGLVKAHALLGRIKSNAVVVFGGSQGAKVMSDIVPDAIEQLDLALRARLLLAQQAREEDLARVRDSYAHLRIAAEVAPFFADLPARIAAAHLVVSRSGAG